MKISWNHFKITQNQAILYKCANATSVVKIKMRTRCSPWALRHDIFSGANFQVLKQYKLCTFLKVTIFLEIDQIIFFFFFNIYIVGYPNMENGVWLINPWARGLRLMFKFHLNKSNIDPTTFITLLSDKPTLTGLAQIILSERAFKFLIPLVKG